MTGAPPAAQMFGGAAREYRWEHGTARETFARIAVEARRRCQHDPNAIFRPPLSIER